MLTFGAASVVARRICVNTGGGKKNASHCAAAKNNIFFPIQATCNNI